MRGHAPEIVTLLILFLTSLVNPGEAQEGHLLVLSEIEERIAGELAFATLEQNLAEQGLRMVADARVSSIGRTLAAYSDRPHLHYAFSVIEGDVPPRAFSLPGGHVVVSRTLIEEICQTDADVAFILGHEIAHSALRHYADYYLQDGQQVAYVKDLLQRYQLFDTTTGNEATFVAVEQILLPYMVKIRQLKEIEADQFGILYALRAGYEFSGGFRVLGRLQQRYGEAFDLEHYEGFEGTDLPLESPGHPDISERLDQLELFRIKALEVAKLFPLGRDALDRGDYREAALIFESILSLFPQSRTALIGLGVAYHLQYWDSSPGDDFLLAYPGALELEYMYLLERGPRDVDALHRAIDQYNQVLAVEPGNSYAQNNLGVALAELQQPEHAEQTLRESLRISNRDFTMFNLGLLLTRLYTATHDEVLKEALKTEAISLMKAYLQEIPHDMVAVQYLEELQEAHP